MSDRRVFRLAAVIGVSLVLMALTTPVWPESPVDIYDFPTPELEARYRALIDEFRCPKCLNTNLSGSDAPIAKDLRGTVRRLLVEEGMSDQQVRDYLQTRYGDFVLYDPPFKPGTWLLWLAPLAFVLTGLWVLVRVLRPRPQVTLSAEEQARVRALLGDR
jgi:cytochrome c-type biogenesis protein CcmH